MGSGSLAISGSGVVTVGGTYAQNADSTLTLTVESRGTSDAFITAASATVGGTISVGGFSSGTAFADAQSVQNSGQQVLISATNGGTISGVFATATLTGFSGSGLPDYLYGGIYKTDGDTKYVAGVNLAWLGDAVNGGGNFSVASGTSFNVNITLSDTMGLGTATEYASGWDGKSLTVTSSNSGTLILSASNTYTGTTTVNGGDLLITNWTGSNARGVIDSAADTTIAPTVTVSGTGYWGIANNLTVGDSGTGYLTINGSGSVQSYIGYLGYGTYATGSVSVGAGGWWNNTSYLFVGRDGAGYLAISGSVSNASGYIGHGTYATGSVSVNAGGWWNNTGNLTVGNTGTGYLAISGSVSNASGYLGYGTYATGSVSVNAGGWWNNSGDLYVGYNGTGYLSVTASGSVNAGNVTIGLADSGSGSVTVSDTSALTVTTALTVGGSGNGTLGISESGSVSAGSATIGLADSGSGSITVSDTSALTVTNALTVGGSGNGTLAVTGSGHVASAAGVIGNAATATGSVSVGNFGYWNLGASDLTVGASGTGWLDLANSGSVSGGNAVIGSAGGAFGTVSVGGTALLDLGGDLTVGGDADATAALTISGSGSVSVGGVYAQTTANSALTLTVTGTRGAFITADSATLASGTLTVFVDGTAAFSGSASGLAANAQTLIATEHGISGTFGAQSVITAASEYDFLVFDAYKSNYDAGQGAYLDYVLGTQLAWYASGTRGTGDFTLGSGKTFDIDVTLADTGSVAGGWNGRTLTVTAGNSGTFILSASNSFSGGADVQGGALVTRRADALGTGTLTVAAGAAVYVSPTASANFALTNALAGSGLLEVNLSAADNQFSIDNSQLFTGTANLLTGAYTLTGGQFANASVVSGSGNLLTVGSGSNRVGNFTFNGGAAQFDIANSSTRAASWLDTGTLTLASGTVRVDGALLANNTAPLVQQDDGVQMLLVNAAARVGEAGALTLTGTDGIAFSTVSGTVTQSGSAVAIGHYTATLSGTGAAGDGLYLADRLTQLDLVTDATLTLTSTTAAGDDFTAAITGTGHVVVSASTTLELTGTNSYSGTTTIDSGAVIASNSTALGASDVVVSSSLVLSFDDATFANDLGGDGEATVSGSGITIGGTNTDFTGTWNVAGSGTMTAPENLGDAGLVNIGGDLSVALTGTDEFVFNPELVGGGTLTVSNSGAFNFGPDTGGGFTGNVVLEHNEFTLDDDNTLALGDATLTVGEGNHTVVGSGTRNVGNLTLDSGTVQFAIAASGTAASGVIVTDTLKLSGSTYIVVDTGSFNRELPLLQQDEKQPVQLIFSTTLEGTAGVIGSEYLRDETGARLTNSTTKAIVQNSATTAQGTYDFSATTSNSGLYLGYDLLALDLLAGQTTVLDRDITNAVLGGGNELHAIVSGSGNLTIAATDAIYLNGSNSYSGTTYVYSGTLVSGTSRALGETAQLHVATTATVDLAGHAEIVGSLDSSGVLNFNGGTLTITGSNGASNSVGANSLSGSGALIVQNDMLTVIGSNTLAVTVTIDQPASVQVYNADSLGTGTVSVGGTLNFISSIPGSLTGTNFNTISGTGHVGIDNGSKVTLGGTNTAFSGTWTIGAGSDLTAVSGVSLGSGTVSATGTLTLGGSGSYAVGNFITGAGALVKADASTVTLTGSNNYRGGSVITSGTLVAANASALGASPVSLASPASPTSPASLVLSFTNAAFANAITGDGLTEVRGTGITVSGTNTAFTGTWNITGSGTVGAAENLGAAGAVDLAANGALTLTGSAWNFNHALTGSGALVVSLDSSTNAFAFGNDTGSAFAGSLLLTSGSYYISDTTSANMTALANATLTLDGGIVTLGTAGGLVVGNLTLHGGTFNTVMSSPTEVATLTVNHLSVASGTNTVVNLDRADLPEPPPAPTGNLIDQANDTNGIQIVAATSVDEAGVQLKLTLDGTTPQSQTYTINDGHGHADVGATYNYSAVTSSGDEHPAGAGRYVGYLLQELRTNSDLVLDTTGATYSTFGAAITGTGNVEFNAHSGTLTLTGSNNYTGATKLAGGTLKVATDNPLFAASSALTITVGAALDLNGHDAQVNNLSGAGLANFADATLTVTSTTNTVFTGTLNGGALVKTGAAQLDADAATAALTQVQVDGGELKLGANATVSGGNEPAVVLTGGTATFNGSKLTNAGGALISATANATVNLNNLTVSATSPGASLIRVEQGALTVNLNNSTAAGDINAANVASGQVSLSGNSALTGRADGVAVVIDTTSRLNLTGNSTLTGLTNNGMVEFVTDGRYDKTLTLGNLTGNGTFSMNVSVAELATDYVTVTGAASGDHQVIIKRTEADRDIIVTRLELPMFGIDPSLSDATFHGETDIGTRVAKLQLGDLSGGHLNEWFLVLSGGENSDAKHGILASAAMRELTWFNNSTLVQRMGELRLGRVLSIQRNLGADHAWDVWVREADAQTDVGAAVSGRRFTITDSGRDVGADKIWALNERSVMVSGGFAGYGRTELDLRSHGGHGLGVSYHAGLYTTWLHDTGWYADAVLKAERYDSDFKAYDASGNQTDGKYKNWTAGVSVEAGRQFQFADGWFAEPQLQASYARFLGTDYTTGADNRFAVHQDDKNVVQLRAGVILGRTVRLGERSALQPYVKASGLEQLSTGGRVTTDDGNWRPNFDGPGAALGAGLIWQLDINNQLHLDYEYRFGPHYDQPWSINAGYRYQF
ncbi:MAG: autotransporter outer membrane beta-barrel domain-containing protein [Verrucomicrobiales bacterium]|nr:autotransporter outer membrane beta-barrel domain-containing protein [Verrucomicrobiales bacterium]